ncbi:MAG: FkbM family methyltransferase [Myxococcota bacterium]|jgi:FkbM family methyltransferase
MRLDPHQHVDGLYLFAPHLVDIAERAFLNRSLSPGGSFLDAGSYLGFYSLIVGPAVLPGGHIVCVEADADTRERLHTHLNRAGLPATTSPVPLTDHGGSVDLVCPDPSNLGSRRVTPGNNRPSETLPALMDRLGIHRFDAVKTDLEGLDDAVVRHTISTLPRARWPIAWVIETPPESGLAVFLAKHGYRTTRLSRLNLGASLDSIREAR